MGGYGSTRWGWHSKKTQVEECHKLTIYLLKPRLRPGMSGDVTWSWGEKKIANISYRVQGDDSPESIRLMYTIGAQTTNPVTYDYPVQLVTSRLSWGKERYWFICPISGCGRRVGCLYIAPGTKYFACRHCYQLSYQTRQEGYKDRALYGYLAGMMQDIIPGATAQMMKIIMRN